MMAPTHHAAMRHVGPTRVELGTRTIFNLLGPLSNPAGVKRQLIGVFSAAWLEPMAEVLRNLGSERVWVTHGSDGLDEITTTGPTKVVELKNGAIHAFEVTPEEAGLARAQPATLKGGEPAQNAEALLEVLDGARRRLSRHRPHQRRGGAHRRGQDGLAQGGRRFGRRGDPIRRGAAHARPIDRRVQRLRVEAADDRHPEKDRELQAA